MLGLAGVDDASCRTTTENSLLAGITLMIGKDPKEEYADKVAEMKVG